jgi:hypothetical protein
VIINNPVYNNAGNIYLAPLQPPDPDLAPAQLPFAPQVNNVDVHPIPIPVHNNGGNNYMAPLRPPDPDSALEAAPEQLPLAPQIINAPVYPVQVPVQNNGGNVHIAPAQLPDPAPDPVPLPIVPQVNIFVMDPIQNNVVNNNMVPVWPPDPDLAPQQAPSLVRLANNIIMDLIPALRHNNGVNINLAPDPAPLPIAPQVNNHVRDPVPIHDNDGNNNTAPILQPELDPVP